MIHTHLGDAVVVEGPAGATLLRAAGDNRDGAFALFDSRDAALAWLTSSE